MLRSWAVPRGLPATHREDRLAVAVDDHDLDHATYTDDDKEIADTGWWELEDRTQRALRVRAARPAGAAATRSSTRAATGCSTGPGRSSHGGQRVTRTDPTR